jgi:hypothetical protein
MKVQAHARWARIFAQSEIPVAMKALAAGLPKEYWDELKQDLLLSAWDFDEAYGDNEDDNRGNNDDGDAFTDLEYGHDGLKKADLMTMTTTAADRDESRDDNE